MQKLIVASIACLIASISWNPASAEEIESLATPPDLIVGPGESRRLPARTYRFGNISIDREGELVLIDGSSRWLILWAEGDVEIAGKITARNFRAAAQEVRDMTPDGRELFHSFENRAIGGTGGAGGSARHNSSGLPGGLGAPGTVEWGGGGGSGAGLYMMGAATRLTEPGRTATDWRAAPATTWGTTSDGDGARSDSRRNGGLVAIRAGGTMNLTGATIDARGNKGADGKRSSGDCPSGFPYGNRGGSGGGGGAPGGDGGQVVLIASKFEGLNSFRALVEGGAGGSGGQTACTFGGATAGSPGDAGTAGYIDRYSLSDWELVPVSD